MANPVKPDAIPPPSALNAVDPQTDAVITIIRDLDNCSLDKVGKVSGGFSREGCIGEMWVDVVSLVVGANNHIGRRPGAKQTGPVLIATMDDTVAGRSVIFHHVEVDFTGTPSAAPIEACLQRLVRFAAFGQRSRGQSVASRCGRRGPACGSDVRRRKAGVSQNAALSLQPLGL